MVDLTSTYHQSTLCMFFLSPAILFKYKRHLSKKIFNLGYIATEVNWFHALSVCAVKAVTCGDRTKLIIGTHVNHIISETGRVATIETRSYNKGNGLSRGGPTSRPLSTEKFQYCDDRHLYLPQQRDNRSAKISLWNGPKMLEPINLPKPYLNPFFIKKKRKALWDTTWQSY